MYWIFKFHKIAIRSHKLTHCLRLKKVYAYMHVREHTGMHVRVHSVIRVYYYYTIYIRLGLRL